MKKIPGNNKLLKEINRAAVLDLIRTSKAVSKAKLAQITGLSPTAIGSITSSLLEDGYIHETGTTESKRGRKPTKLELKAGSYYSVGFDIDVDCIGSTLIDITGQILYENYSPLPHGIDAEGTMGLIEKEIGFILEKYGIEMGRLLGAGISIAGMVNYKTGEILLAPNLGWSNVDLKSYAVRFPNISFYVENEARSSAICENWIGSCTDIKDFVCINVKSGIGAGIFADGKIYRGVDGIAGEIGHIPVDENGPRCGCGNYGCLETMASTQYIVENAKRLIRQGVVSSLNEISDVDAIDLEAIVKAAKEGDEASKGIFTESARYLGIAISNIVNILNPSRIVIGKEFVKYSDLVIDYLRNFVSVKALKASSTSVEIITSSMGERSSVIGAAIIPLRLLFGK